VQRPWFVSLFIAVLAILLLTPVADAGPPAIDGERLNRFDTRFYTIYTNLPREDIKPFGQHMDVVFHEYTRRFSKFDRRNHDEMPLYLLHTQKDYLALLQQFGIDGRNTGGMFFVNRLGSGLVTWVDGRPRDQTLTVLQHEGFHQFTYYYIGEALPTWVDEGLAQYFEDGIVVDDRQFRFGFANASRIAVVQQAIEADDAFAFDTLLTMSAELWRQVVAGSQQRSAVLYGQAWSMVYFLVHADDGKYRKAFETYLQLISRGIERREAFELAFETRDTDAFRRRWEKFIRDLQPDALHTAKMKMEFLGMGMKTLIEQGVAPPTSLTELKRELKRRGMRLRRVEDGVTTEFDARDEDIYLYHTTEGGFATFDLLKPTHPSLPPRLHAPNLDPQPVLTWQRINDRDLIPAFEYR